MELIKYSYKNPPNNEFLIPKFDLKEVNLIVGISGVGKTRLLNTIRNLFFMIQNKRETSPGTWDINIKIKDKIYNYILEIESINNENLITKEVLKLNDIKIINRTKTKFFFNKKEIPNLNRKEVGLYLLKDDKIIKEIFEEFNRVHILRLDPLRSTLNNNQLSGFSDEALKKDSEFSIEKIHKLKGISARLFMLKEHKKKIFNKIKQEFISIFPFVEDLLIKDIKDIKNVYFDGDLRGFTPILLIKEKGISNEIPFVYFSSGMLRAITQLVDIHILPEESIYLIDEIENSMGILSLPDMIETLINECSNRKIQLIFTSHHPYIIKNLDVKYWKVLVRKAGKIKVISGDEIKKNFSKNQDPYIQLINTEYFEKGI